ncbi:MAG: hypothetical protein DMG15_25050 [Acidobacteria bacterium]|nr:MAG: hypothetical protein DMG15_25050 [Acidobacteriota bacterium]
MGRLTDLSSVNLSLVSGRYSTSLPLVTNTPPVPAAPPINAPSAAPFPPPAIAPIAAPTPAAPPMIPASRPLVDSASALKGFVEIGCCFSPSITFIKVRLIFALPLTRPDSSASSTRP